MKLNIYNNFRAIYYNTLANFYLCFNSIVPYYDDVIISLSITSFKNIINNNLNLKSIKQNRMMQLLYSLNDKDKIIVDEDGYIIIYYDKDAKICSANADEHVAAEDAEEDAEDAEEAEETDIMDDDAINPEEDTGLVEETTEPKVSPSNPEEDTGLVEETTEPEVLPSNPEEDTDLVEKTTEPEVSLSNPEEPDEVIEPYNSSDKKNN
jgi:hypothetical protein